MDSVRVRSRKMYLDPDKILSVPFTTHKLFYYGLKMLMPVFPNQCFSECGSSQVCTLMCSNMFLHGLILFYYVYICYAVFPHTFSNLAAVIQASVHTPLSGGGVTALQWEHRQAVSQLVQELEVSRGQVSSRPDPGQGVTIHPWRLKKIPNNQILTTAGCQRPAGQTEKAV